MNGFLTSRLFSFLACLIAGGISTHAMAPTNLWLLMIGGISILYFASAYARSPLHALLYGWAFGFGYFTFGLSWIGNALLVEGNNYAWAWPLAVMGLPAFLALYQGLAMFLFRLSGNTKTVSGLIVFVILLGGSEILRGFLFTGFPWNLYGYSWAGLPEMLQSVALINSYGLTVLTVFWGAIPAYILLSLNNKTFSISSSLLILLAVGSALFLYAFGQWRIENTALENRTDISIKLVQPNIPQAEKWDSAKMQSHYEELNALSVANGEERETTYIIWPETAINPRIMADIGNKELLQETLSTYRGKAYLFTGALRFEPGNGSYYNSLLLFNQSAQNIQIYDKSHLVPFGEYIPFQNLIPLAPVAKFNGFARGEGPDNQSTPEGLNYSALICYEIIFPGNVIQSSAPAPDFIVNVTNDAWYGDSAGPRQHLTQAIFRAVEEGVPVIRVANTGISALIDPLGNIRESIPLNKTGNVIVTLPHKNETRLLDFTRRLLH